VLSIAALALIAATAGSSPAPSSTSPWWEKITYTMSGDGAEQACEFESSDESVGIQRCDVDKSASPVQAAAHSPAGAYTKITIERRFSPGRPDPGSLELGDTLLGGQVMALAIDGTGVVRSCQVVVESGEVRPAYGCEEARTERFEGGPDRSAAEAKQGFMTVLVYGHEEQVA
jgi:hypothetical protein